MSSPIGGISFPGMPVTGVGAVPDVVGARGVDSVNGPAAAAPAPSGGFAAALTGAVDQLQGAHTASDGLAAQAATGDLRDVHDYMIASREAALATEMVVTIKNKAVDAFNEIMRMPV